MWVVSRLGSNLGLAILWFEEQLVLQSRVRINAGLTLLALGVYTQLALVLKKKQFERLRAMTSRLDMCPRIGH